jgi:hypothetical protein
VLLLRPSPMLPSHDRVHRESATLGGVSVVHHNIIKSYDGKSRIGLLKLEVQSLSSHFIH